MNKNKIIVVFMSTHLLQMLDIDFSFSYEQYIQNTEFVHKINHK